MSYLELIRYKNLLFLLVVMLCMQYCVAQPLLGTYGFAAAQPLATWHLALLCCATLCTAGAGYAINDYFDIKIDTINRPDKRIVGVSIDKRHAMLVYQVLTGIGIAMGLALSLALRSTTMAMLFIIMPGVLWFYSASYKRQLIVGNIVVAFCAATAVMLVGIANIAALKATYGTALLAKTTIMTTIYEYLGVFALMAFLFTLLRELIKDMEDIEGDREMECHTMPIVWGIKAAKGIGVALLWTTIALLSAIVYYHANSATTWRYMLIGIVLPAVILTVMLLRADTQDDYHRAQQMVKFIMAAGVLYSIPLYYTIARTAGLLFFGLIPT